MIGTFLADNRNIVISLKLLLLETNIYDSTDVISCNNALVESSVHYASVHAANNIMITI